MVTAYHLVLFVHILAVAALFVASAVSHIGIANMEKAETRELALGNCKLALDNGPIFSVASLLIVATGIYLSTTAWSITAPWVLLALGAVVVSTVLGFAVMYRRLGAIFGHLAALPDGPLPEYVKARRRDPIAALLPSALTGNAIGTLFLMILKPGWWMSAAILVGFTIAGLVPVWGRARESWLGFRRARDLRKTFRANQGKKPILCDVLDPHLVVVETVSPFTLKAHKALQAAGIEYITRRAPEATVYEHLNPKAQIPILLLPDGEIVSGSRSIVRLCARWAPDAFDADLTPEQQGEVHLWEEYAENTLKGILGFARWMDERNWERAKEAYFVDLPFVMRPIIIPRVRKAIVRIMRSMDVGRGGLEEEWPRFVKELDMLERRAPATGFWLGTSKLSPADFSLFGFLHSMRCSMTPMYHEEIKKRPRLDAYLDRVEAMTRREAQSPDVMIAPTSEDALRATPAPNADRAADAVA